MAFYRKAGKENAIKVVPKSADTLAIGDVVAIDSTNDQVTIATTDGAIFGLALQASASGSTTKINVDVLSPGEWIMGKVENGTPGANHLQDCDINSQDGVILSNTNSDFLAMYRGDYDGTTYHVYLLPKNLHVVENT